MGDRNGIQARPSFPTRLYDLMLRRRAVLLGCLCLGVLAGMLGTTRIGIDMSFRPTFSGDEVEVERTAAHERRFGQVGFRELVALVEPKNATDPRALEAVGALAARLRRIPGVSEVRDPLTFPFYDESGRLHPLGIVGSLPRGAPLDGEAAGHWVGQLLRSPSARRLVVGDGDRKLAVAAVLAIPNEDFAARRRAVALVRDETASWSRETGMRTELTGYPEVEQVYAEEVLASVVRSILALLAVMVAILYVYFRRLRDVFTCLAGVTLSVPLVLGAMALLGQPFSIVNSQVLTLVLIVGIAEALHHQEEYRRRREAGREHAVGNRDAFSILLWPAFMTGLATAAGFLALVAADMQAIWSFGVSTALGVVVVYLVNWLVVPPLIDRFYRRAGARTFVAQRSSFTLSVVSRANDLLQRYPRSVVAGFVLVTLALVGFGVPRLSIDQKVNEELFEGHPALSAQAAFERDFSGFLGPELAVEPHGGDLASVSFELAALVNRLCDMPEVRYVASPLDFLPQPAFVSGATDKPCRRAAAELGPALAARAGAAGPLLRSLASGVISEDGKRASLIVRVADIGTARSLPFVERIRGVARETMPHATVRPVGQWWLAQQGMQRLSFDMMLSAITALLVILPIMAFAIRDTRLFLAALPATILPVFATLGFMGALGITVRIGTAMILAIALGLAADDTIHLSVRIRDRIRRGSDPKSAVAAALLRTGRPCSFSSYVLIGGFASMLMSSLIALREMGIIAMFTMAFALATDLVLGPALYLLLDRRPEGSPAPDTLRGLLLHTLERHPERPAQSYPLDLLQRGAGRPVFRTLTWHEVGRLVLAVAEELDQRFGAARVVAAFSDTDARYPLLELACGVTGRALQPLYVTATDAELADALSKTGAPLVVCGRSQLERARACLGHPALVALDSLVTLPGIDGKAEAVLPPDVEPFDTREVRARLAGFPARAPEAPLLYLQSTGTTGPARVIELSELALLGAVRAVEGEASHRFPRFLSFLPTAHISERFLTLYLSLALGGHTYHGGGLATLDEDLRACRPTVLLAPPLLLEALKKEAIARASSSGLGRCLIASVRDDADRLIASGVTGGVRRSALARLFSELFRRSAGLDHVRDGIAGTAPLGPELHAWFEAAGIPLRIAYGQTELAGAMSMTARSGARFGSVGVPVAGVEVKLTERGELVVRSQAAFTRYVGDPVATGRTLAGGWLATGDRGRLLETEEIALLGRVQSLLPAADGRLVDLELVAAELRRALGPADVAFQRASPAFGAFLYVALHPESSEHESVLGPERIPETDARFQRLLGLVERLDPAGVVLGLALYDGVFTQLTGEVGPTGKARPWRIHELRARELSRRHRSGHEGALPASASGTLVA